MKSQLKVNDKLWKEIKAKIPQIDKVVVKTGIQSNAGENGGVSIAEYAAFNEFGTRTIPERPFMRKTFDDNISNWNALTERLLKGILDNKIDVKSAFELLGEKTQNDMKDTITSGNFEKNSDITINGGWMKSPSGKTFYVKGKGDKRPLIDTGTMLNSIRYEVENV